MEKSQKVEIALVTALFVCSIIIFIIYKKEYPCTVSGCGCHDIWEMIGDTWPGIQLFIGILAYACYLFHLI